VTRPVLLSKHVLPLSARPVLPQNAAPLRDGMGFAIVAVLIVVRL
jgi:hypothetical protein